MRSLPFPDAAFRAVVNFFTSFGYFRTEAENTAVVAEIERVLRPGGAFLCDTFGRSHVLCRGSCRRSAGSAAARSTASGGPSTPQSARLEKEIEVRRGGSCETFRESVRAYAPDELAALLEGAGLRVQSVWGDFDESPLSPDSPRLIVLARKPEKPS